MILAPPSEDRFVRNRTFFFVDFNGIRALNGATSRLVGVPSAAERSGNFGELCARAGGTFSSSGVCSNPAGQIYDPYTSQPNAQNIATGRAPIPFDNLATYISPGNPGIPIRPGKFAGEARKPDRPGRRQTDPGVSSAESERRHRRLRSLSQLGRATGRHSCSQQSFDINLDHHFNEQNVLSVKFSHEWDSSQNANFFGTVYDTNTQGPTKHAALLGDVNYVHTFNPSTLLTVSARIRTQLESHRWRSCVVRRIRSGAGSGNARVH